MASKYFPTIGIECHVQLKTQTKLFSRVSNDARDAEPNTTVSPICFGLPGVLPVLNEGAIELAIRAGHALNAQVAEFSKFDRKHYFYPDLPKGYQITQYDRPIVGEGYVDVPVDGETVRVGIERAHLEEDAGKSTHPPGADYSLVDLNRAGTPLLEIVSKPDMHSPAEAKAYVRELYLLMKYADVSDADLYYGHMRFDVNISLATEGKLGTRAEIKNLNSFRAVEKAASFEIERQTKLLERGGPIVQETRGWDDAKQKTFSQRTKEEAHDYRYFPDPDLPPVVLAGERIKAEGAAMAAMPNHYRELFSKLGLARKQAEVIIEDNLLAQEFGGMAENLKASHLKRIANWLVGDIQRLANKTSAAKLPLLSPKLFLNKLVELSEMVEQRQLSSNGASAVVEELVFDKKATALSVAKEKQLLQVSDSAQIERIVGKVIENNPKAAKDVKNGETRAIGFLVGQVMKESKGQANPQLAQETIRQQLGV